MRQLATLPPRARDHLEARPVGVRQIPGDVGHAVGRQLDRIIPALFLGPASPRTRCEYSQPSEIAEKSFLLRQFQHVGGVLPRLERDERLIVVRVFPQYNEVRRVVRPQHVQQSPFARVRRHVGHE